MVAVRALIAIGLAAFWLLLVVPPMFQNPPTVYAGTHRQVSGAPLQPNLIRVDPGSPAFRAGLRTGDELACLSPRDARLLFFSAGYRAGTPISTCVRRNGVWQSVQFVARAGPPVPNWYGSNALAALRVCVVLVFFLTGIALVMSRPSLMTWIFYAFCLGSAPSFASSLNWAVLPSWQYAIVAGLPNVANILSVEFLLLFAVLVPSDTVPSGWRRIAFRIASVVAVAGVIFAVINFYYTGFRFKPEFTNGIDEALTGITVLIVVARLATMERVERARFGWAAFAIIFGVVVNDLRNVFAVQFSSIGTFASYLTVVMPLCLMYAILKRHVIDVRFVISRTVLYAVLTTLVVLVIGIVDWLTSAYLTQVRVAMAIDAAVTISVAFALHRTYRWIENAVDLLLFRQKHQADAYLRRLARTLLRAEKEETIDHELVHGPYDRLELQMAALFRPQDQRFVMAASTGFIAGSDPGYDNDHKLVRFLITERAKIDIRDLRTPVPEKVAEEEASPAVAIPVFKGDELAAFAVYGIHRDGTKLDPDEIATLEHLCEVAAQAYVRIELLRYRSLEQIPAVA